MLVWLSFIAVPLLRSHRPLLASGLPLLLALCAHLWSAFDAVERARWLPAEARMEALAAIHREAARPWPVVLVLAVLLLPTLWRGPHRPARIAMWVATLHAGLLGTALMLVHARAAAVPLGYELDVWRESASWMRLPIVISTLAIVFTTLIAAARERDTTAYPWLLLGPLALMVVAPDTSDFWWQSQLWLP